MHLISRNEPPLQLHVGGVLVDYGVLGVHSADDIYIMNHVRFVMNIFHEHSHFFIQDLSVFQLELEIEYVAYTAGGADPQYAITNVRLASSSVNHEAEGKLSCNASGMEKTASGIRILFLQKVLVLNRWIYIVVC